MSGTGFGSALVPEVNMSRAVLPGVRRPSEDSEEGEEVGGEMVVVVEVVEAEEETMATSDGEGSHDTTCSPSQRKPASFSLPSSSSSAPMPHARHSSRAVLARD